MKYDYKTQIRTDRAWYWETVREWFGIIALSVIALAIAAGAAVALVWYL